MKLVNKFDIKFFIKVGDKQYIRPLLEKGEVYLNTIEYYRSQELPNGVRDEYEGCAGIDLKSKVFIEIDGKFEELKVVDSILSTHSEINQGNIYCMYAVKADHKTQDVNGIGHFVMDNDFGNHGDCFLQIFKPKEFIERIDRECQKQGLGEIYFGLVEYFEDEYSGEMTPFMKRKRFEPQSEARIYINNTKHEPIKLEIGSIEDIAFIMKKT